ncbi:PREDICTED: zinc finger protein 32-like isoform X2 [Nicrophorus vespilloides]|uniref:Zinc finger protein 32-like isoform X2 n=1 Tax=Nicrophorus vespilloides TaxID=110193 RepID=A0ABM1MQ30_NICVS|nr:PREDICTED: zinc finger protein 32-like isoform X2 [Nicrophorus vespilloides]
MWKQHNTYKMKMSEDICRLCLQKGSQNNFISLNFGQPSIKSKLLTLIPEMNLDVIQDPVICGPCSAALENAYQLKVKCLRSEEKIWAHLNRTMDMKSFISPVKLINLLPNADYLNHEEIMVEPNFNFYQHQGDHRADVRVNENKSYHSLDATKQNNVVHNKVELNIPNAKTINQTSNSFVCSTCKQTFPSQEELHIHIPKHLGTRPYMCTYCYKCFTLKSNLQIHIRTHTQDKPYACEYCSKSFTTKGNLKTHIRVHTKEKPYVCQICEKSFIQKVQLNTHMLLHENDQIFACDICEKNFSTKATLQVHKRIHDDIKPYVCDYCSKSFTTNGNLQIHVRKHTGEKPYVCNCSRSFTQLGQLKKHQLTHETNGDFQGLLEKHQELIVDK